MDKYMGCLLSHQKQNHQPLISIYKNNLNDMSPRIQRMMMRLQGYDMDLIYTPGKYIVLADALSRAPAPPQAAVQSREAQTKSSKELERHVNLIVSSLPVSDMVLKKFSQETEQDETLQAVAAKLDYHSNYPEATWSHRNP